ncbi:hypothetical protein ALC57_14989 [Trachymyrmex cornetzi]|uniref:Uncharacterized protein n=1 Tax=Trachymyrmex cornetzi TaxID=471704 RepID=A0A195DKB7_9HYME|nr:hypothetical protein ALC57_14989 [Trachymyrmex cornetzi]
MVQVSRRSCRECVSEVTDDEIMPDYTLTADDFLPFFFAINHDYFTFIRMSKIEKTMFGPVLKSFTASPRMQGLPNTTGLQGKTSILHCHTEIDCLIVVLKNHVSDVEESCLTSIPAGFHIRCTTVTRQAVPKLVYVLLLKTTLSYICFMDAATVIAACASLRDVTLILMPLCRHCNC